MPPESAFADVQAETAQSGFVYEAPGTSSMTKTLCLRPIGDNGEYVTLELRLYDPNGYGEGCPYLWSEAFPLPWSVLKDLRLWIARNGRGGNQTRPRPQNKMGR